MGKCIIFSAPSGAGKTTLVKHLLSKNIGLQFSISACTRGKRGDEIDGKDYYFLDIESFKSKIKADEFIEWEEVYTDHFYGTLKAEINRIWDEDQHVIFDVDVIGGINLKKYFGDQALSIFVMPPSLKDLKKRLLGRGTDTEDRINNRMAKAKQELIVADQFDHIILNNDLDTAKREAFQLVNDFIKL